MLTLPGGTWGRHVVYCFFFFLPFFSFCAPLLILLFLILPFALAFVFFFHAVSYPRDNVSLTIFSFRFSIVSTSASCY
jgi:hypothetical protein